MSLAKQAFAFFLFIIVFSANAQPQYAFRIGFVNKDGAASISNPLVFLSQKAIDRRNKFSINIEESDRPVSPYYIDSVLTLTFGKLHVTSRWLNQCVILLDDSSKILQLQGKTFINNIQYIAYFNSALHRSSLLIGKDINNNTELKSTSNATYYGSTWAQTNLLHGDCLHDLGYKGNGKIIALLDDGFKNVNNAVGFDSLMAKNHVIDKHNFVHNDTLAFGYGLHGTTVLSTIVGNLPNNYIGAAIEAETALYVTEDNTSEKEIELDNLIAGMERADSLGADIISSSLGYNNFEIPFPSFTFSNLDGKSTIAAKAVNIASQKGLLCIISAGNEGGNSWNNILTPGDADSALTIGSVDNNKMVASSSGYGPNAAGIIKPDLCAQGNPSFVLSTGSIPISENGTSLATPQIAGYAACLMQAFPTKTPFQIKDAIKHSCHLFSNPNNHAGFGVPDFCNAFNILGLEDVSPHQKFSIFPNPSKGRFTLILDQLNLNQAQLLLTDVLGKVIINQKLDALFGKNSFTFSIPENAANGLYCGQIFINNEVITFNLLKD